MKRSTGHLAALLLPAIGWSWLTALTIAALLGAAVRRHNFEASGIAFGVGLVIFIAGHYRTRTAASNPSRSLGVVILPIVAAVAAFSWTLTLGPLSDDFVLHRLATSGNWAPDGWEYFRPLPLAIWGAVTGVGGEWRALHGLNVGIHAVNSALVAVVAATWIGRRGGIVAGVVFALIPASTEAVAWLSGIFDLCATLFVLLATVAWTRLSPSLRHTLLLVAAGTAACLSKETAIALPALLVSFAVFAMPEGQPFRQRSLQFLVLTLAIGLVMFGVVARRPASAAPIAEQLQALRADRREWKDVLVKPYGALAAPIRTDSGRTPEAFLAGLALLVLIGSTLIDISRRRPAEERVPPPSGQLAMLAVGAGWILLSALPLLRQLLFAPTMEGGRYVYLPAVGLAFVVSSAFPGNVGVRRSLTPSIALGIMLVIYGVGMHGEQGVWREAARTRDAVLSEAAGVVQAVSCRSLEIIDPPDNVRGAFVFRVGLTEALSGLTLNPKGARCVYRWTGATLVPSQPIDGR